MNELLGSRIRTLRTIHNYTQEQMAEKMGGKQTKICED